MSAVHAEGILQALFTSGTVSSLRSQAYWIYIHV